MEYDHSDGISITGGFVYRGTRIAGLQGSFLYADYCVGDVYGLSGATGTKLNVNVPHPVSFGQDKNGELWVLSQDGGVYRLLRKTT